MTKSFNVEKHKQALEKGSSTVKEGYFFPIDETNPVQQKQQLIIERMHASIQGKGFGTALYRETMQYAFEKGMQLWTDASWNSHVFHLYMGMIPKDRKMSYVPIEYGQRGVRSLNQLIASKTIDEFIQCNNQSNGRLLRELIDILKQEKKELADASLTAQDVFENKDFMIDLQNKDVSYLTYSFIPSLLKYLYNNCGDLGSVHMYMSTEGQARWQDAINENKEFDIFEQFEHLHPYMLEEQKQALKKVLAHYNHHKTILKNNTVKSELKLSIQDNKNEAASDSEEDHHNKVNL